MKRITRSLQILPLGCLTLLGGATDAQATCQGGGVCVEGTVTSSANPVPIGEEFELILSYDFVPNVDVQIKFYQSILGIPDPVLDFIYVPDIGTGEGLVAVSQSILADETIFFQDGCALFYATVVGKTQDPNPIYEQTPTVQFCLQYESSTAAETVSRVLPVFRATVEPIEPATEMPTGEVEFYVGNTKVCTGEVDEDGEASCFSLNQVISLHSHYTAKYTGDGVFGPSEDQGSFSPF